MSQIKFSQYVEKALTEDKEGFECFKSKSCEDQIDQLFKIIKKLENQNKELDKYRGHLEKRVVTELMLKYSKEYTGKTDAEKRKLSGVINRKYLDAMSTESNRNLHTCLYLDCSILSQDGNQW